MHKYWRHIVRSTLFGCALIVALHWQAATADEMVMVSAPDNKLNLRDGPDVHANIVTVLTNNTRLRISDSLPNGWDQVTVAVLGETGAPPPEPLAGFVNGKYLMTASAMTGQAFRDGHAARLAWETWFNGLTGDYRDGAEYWAAHRSDDDPPDCTSLGSVDFQSGCEAASQKLEVSDRRRVIEPEYRAGWNSPLDASTEAEPAPSAAAAASPPAEATEPATPPDAGTRASADQEQPLQWEVVRKQDKLSDEVSTSARADYQIDGGGRFEITAECLAAGLPLFGDTQGFSITFDYYYPGHQNAHFIWSVPDDGDKFVGLRSRLDNNAVVFTKSSSDYTNEAGVAFVTMAVAQQQNSRNPFASLLGGFAEASMQGLVAGHVSDFFNSRRLRVELPLDDGRTPVVDIATRDPAFKTVSNSCFGNR